MHFYRHLQPIKARSFDLDDTLYDNGGIVEAAEVALLRQLQQIPNLSNLSSEQLNQAKEQILQKQPTIFHDVVAWREQGLNLLLLEAGLNGEIRQQLIQNAMRIFVTYRHKIKISVTTHQLLSGLTKKVLLVTISNGNVNIEKINLGQYFRFSLRSGPDGRSKPCPDLFMLSAQKLSLTPCEILHVGDNLHTDIFGAIQSGMQAAWLNFSHSRLYYRSDSLDLTACRTFAIKRAGTYYMSLSGLAD